MSPDDVCGKWAEVGAKITIRKLDEETILIQGTKVALNLLSELILAQANFEGDDGFQIGPSCAGSTLFTSESTKGIYISRIDGADN